MDMNVIGQQVRAARQSQELTQTQLAQRAGVSREWVIRLEKGDSPRLEFGRAIAVLQELGLAISPLESLATEQDRKIVRMTAFNMAYENQHLTSEDELRILRKVVSQRISKLDAA